MRVISYSRALSLFVVFALGSSVWGGEDKKSDEEMLTGVWIADGGAGVYYSRLVGKDFYMFGEGGNGGWANIIVGRLSGDTIRGEWVDIPKGTDRNFGKIELKLDDNRTTLTTQTSDGGFAGREWKRLGDKMP
jgi:hypothetical protein